jgi:hypothetical protein
MFGPISETGVSGDDEFPPGTSALEMPDRL